MHRYYITMGRVLVYGSLGSIRNSSSSSLRPANACVHIRFAVIVLSSRFQRDAFGPGRM